MSSSLPPSAPPTAADPPILAEFADHDPGRDPRRGARFAAVMIGLLLAGMLVLLGIAFIPGEVQRWQLAAAEEQRLNGDSAGALEWLNEQIREQPRDVELRRKKAQWLMADHRYDGALEEVNQILAWRPADVSAYMLRSQIYHGLGKHEQAVADCQRILEFDSVGSGPNRAEALNALAYARALADLDVDRGLVEISEAMRLAGENFPMLDTRGFLYYRQGDLDRALQDLNYAVSFAEARYASLNDSSARVPFADRRLKELNDLEEARLIAVIRYHRGLVLAARGEEELAEQDFQRVRELGFEPGDQLF